MAILQFTPSKVTRESLGFFIPSCGFRIPDSRYYIPDYSVWQIHGRGPGGGGGGGAHVNKATRDALLMVANIFIYASLFGGNITGRRQIFG